MIFVCLLSGADSLTLQCLTRLFRAPPGFYESSSSLVDVGGRTGRPFRRIFPIQRLPIELLLLIFTFVVMGEDKVVREDVFVGSDFSATSTHHPAPLNLVLVCKAWKDLAYRLPSLWTRIRYTQRIGSPKSCQRQALEVVGRWIERSKKAPLDISLVMELPRSYLHFDDDNDGTPEDDSNGRRQSRESTFQLLLDMVTAERARWRHVKIILDGRDDKLVTPTLNFADLHELRSLELDVRGHGSINVDLSSSTRLASLTLKGNYSVRLGIVPFQNLRHVSLDWYRPSDIVSASTVDDIVYFMKRVPNLEELSATICVPMEGKAKPRIRLEALRRLSLDIQGLTSHSVKEFFDFLTTPSLDTLNLTIFPKDMMPRVPLGIADLLVRSDSSLSSLTLKGQSFLASETIECLHASPLLKHLSLEGVSVIAGEAETFLKRFAIPSMHRVLSKDRLDTLHIPSRQEVSTTLCPKLEEFEFCSSDTYRVYPLLSNVLISRWTGQPICPSSVRSDASVISLASVSAHSTTTIQSGSRVSRRDSARAESDPRVAPSPATGFKRVRLSEKDIFFVKKNGGLRRCVEQGLILQPNDLHLIPEQDRWEGVIDEV